MFDNLLYTTNDLGANICESDLRFAMETLEPLAPKVIVEIGTYRGGSARLWNALFSPSVIITIDASKMADLDDVPGVHYLHGQPSQNEETLDNVRRILDGREIDFLFIDGGHLYPEVKADFEMYYPLVRGGGVIMFHDVYYDIPGRVEVVKYIPELMTAHEVKMSKPGHGVSGVGIIVKSDLRSVRGS